MMRTATVFLLLFCARSAFAAEPLTRREGFLRIWAAIDRPAEETGEQPFPDVPEGSIGALEITYAKRRGLLNADASFRPDDPLTLGDALVWLLRTRNVAYPDDISLDSLPIWLERYPISSAADIARTLQITELASLMETFDQMLREEVHEVSLYAEQFHGKGTAFGESFDMYALTAAHRTFPHNTRVRVTNVENGKSVVVRINDRGPFVQGRDMDLSLAAFTSIAERSRGVIRARFERMGTVPDTEGNGTSTVSGSAVPDVIAVPACPSVRQSFQRIGGGVALHRRIPNTRSLERELRLSAKRAFVVQSVTGPDDAIIAGQDFVLPGEVFVLRPLTEGEYVLMLRGAQSMRLQTIRVQFLRCAEE